MHFTLRIPQLRAACLAEVGKACGLTYHLTLLLILQFLVQLTQAGVAFVVRAVWPGAARPGRALELSRGGKGRVVEVEVHADAGPATRPLDVPPHTTAGGAPILILDAGVHGGSGS